MKDQKHSEKKELKSIQKDVTPHAEGATFQLEDNRQESAVQLKWKDNLKNNSSVSFTDNRASTVQLHVIASSPVTNPTVQMTETGEGEQEKQQVPHGLQYTAQLAAGGDPGSASTTQLKSSNSGLPAKLQSGVESLSGQSMSDVTVHKNSSKPAQLNAHAYAQGTDIHVAPGQEKHLPHEAWHVAQQKQGRVKPTKQLKGKVPVNDDTGLEREADIMGVKALNYTETLQPKFSSGIRYPVAQLEGKEPTGGTEAAVTPEPTTATAAVEPAGGAEVAAAPESTTDTAVPEQEPESAPEGSYNFTEPGFVIETGSMRKLDMVSAIIRGSGNDDEKSKAIESGGSQMAKLTGGSFKLKKELDPKKLGYYIPVKFDVNAKNKIDKWEPAEIDLESPHLQITKDKGSKLKSMGFAPKGYFDTKKALKSKINMLKKEGIKITDKDNTLNTAVKSSYLAKGASALLNNSVTLRGMANKAVEKGIDSAAEAAGKAADFINTKAKKEIQVLKDISFGLDNKATKITPLGSIVTVKGGYSDKFSFSSTFKVNTHTDYSSEYMGSVVSFKSFTTGDPAKVSFALNAGELMHDPDASSQLLSSSKGSMEVGIMGQKVGATWDKLEMDAKTGTITQAKISSVAVNLDLFGSKGTFNIQKPDVKDGKLEFTKAEGSIDQINPMKGISFTDLKGSLAPVGDKYNVAASGKVAIAISPVEEVSATVSINKEGDKDATFSVADGNFKLTILGQKITATGMTYNSTDKTKVSATGAALSVDINHPSTGTVVKGTGSLTNPSISEAEGFKYDKTVLDFKEITLFKGISFKNSLIELTPNGKGGTDLTNGTSDFAITGGDFSAATGTVNFSKIGESPATYALANGTFKAAILGQELTITNVSYNSTDPKVFKAEGAALTIDIDNPSTGTIIKGTGNLANPVISEANGFGYDEANLNFPQIDLFHGVSFTGVSAKLSPNKETNGTDLTDGAATFSIAGGKLANASGDVTFSKISGAVKAAYTLNNGAFEADILGQKVGVTGVSYDSASPDVIKAAGSSLTVDIEHPATGTAIKGTGSLKNPKISKTDGFGYEEANLDFPVIKPFNGVSFTEVGAKLAPNENGGTDVSDGKATFAINVPNLANASGKVTFAKPSGGKAAYTLNNGSFDATMVGQKVAFTGVTYDSAKPNELSADEGALNLDIFGKKVGLSVTEPTVNESGFDFKSATGTINELAFGGDAKLSNIKVDIVKGAKGNSLFGETDFNLKGSMGGAAVEGATGKLKVSRTAEDNETNLILENANFALNLWGQKLAVQGLKYENKVLTATQASIEIKAPSFSDNIPKAVVEELKISPTEYSFKKATVSGLGPVDGGVIKVTPQEVVVERKENNYVLSATGSVGLRAFSSEGEPPALQGSGTIGYDFASKSIQYAITEGSSTFSNPLAAYQIPGSIPGIPWPLEIGADVPIMPGLGASIGAKFDGALGFGPNISIIAKKQGEGINVEGSAEINGNVSATLYAGVVAGIPILASVTAGLEAGGYVQSKLTATIGHTFNLGKGQEPKTDEEKLTPKNTSAIKMVGGGDIKLAAKVFLKGQALYFIKKEVSKTLVEKSLGSFTMDTDKSPIFEFNKTAKDISSKEEMDALNKTMLPKAFHKLDAAEIMNVLDQATDEDGKINLETVTAFAKSFEVAENAKAEEIFNKLQKMSLVNYNLIKWDNLGQLKERDNRPWPVKTKTFDHNLTIIKTSVGSKGAFIDAYEDLINAAALSLPDDREAQAIIVKHRTLLAFYEKLNHLKQFVHSRAVSDTVKVMSTRAAESLRNKVQPMRIQATLKDYINEIRLYAEVNKEIYNEVMALEEPFLAKLQPEETPPAAEGPETEQNPETEEQSAAPVLEGAE